MGVKLSGRCEEIDQCTHTAIVTYKLILYSAGMSNMPAPPLPRLASIDRSQLLLHTLDVERLIETGGQEDVKKSVLKLAANSTLKNSL
jgi:hypothetical protein